MIFNKRAITLLSFLLCMHSSITAEHDVLLELKGGAFIPTSEVFKDIYQNCGFFGGELTLGNLPYNLHAFGSIDFFVKHGNTVELSNPTKIAIVNFALGVKYFVPFEYGDFYIGLGVQPSHLTTLDLISANSFLLQSQWGCGGIAKIGTIFDMSHSLFIDLFFDYSFVKFNNLGQDSGKTPVNGALLGVGFGYRFN